MTTTQIWLGWGVYLIGAFFLFLGYFWLISSLSSTRIKRFLIALFCSLFLTPWVLDSQQFIVIPAFFSMIYEVVTYDYEHAKSYIMPLVASSVIMIIVFSSFPVSTIRRRYTDEDEMTL